MDTLLYTRSSGETVISYKNPNNKNAARKKFVKYFRDRFPLFYNWLKEVKKQKSFGGNAKNRNNPGGSKLATEIQRMEANLWIHSLLEHIPEDIIYFTIHDSVMIFNPDEDTVSFVDKKFRELSKQMYGVEMPVKVKGVN